MADKDNASLDFGNVIDNKKEKKADSGSRSSYARNTGYKPVSPANASGASSNNAYTPVQTPGSTAHNAERTGETLNTARPVNTQGEYRPANPANNTGNNGTYRQADTNPLNNINNTGRDYGSTYKPVNTQAANNTERTVGTLDASRPVGASGGYKPVSPRNAEQTPRQTDANPFNNADTYRPGTNRTGRDYRGTYKPVQPADRNNGTSFDRPIGNAASNNQSTSGRHSPAGSGSADQTGANPFDSAYDFNNRASGGASPFGSGQTGGSYGADGGSGGAERPGGGFGGRTGNSTGQTGSGSRGAGQPGGSSGTGGSSAEGPGTRTTLDLSKPNSRLGNNENSALKSIEKSLETPGKAIAGKALEGDEETNEGMEKVKSYAEVPIAVGTALGNIGGKDEIRNALKKRSDSIVAGDKMESILADAGVLPRDQIVDLGELIKHAGEEGSPLNYGHLKAFEYVSRHTDILHDDVLDPDTGFKALNAADKDLINEKIKEFEGKESHPLNSANYKKRWKKFEKAINANQVESYARDLVNKNPSLFTVEEKEVLEKENELFGCIDPDKMNVRNGILYKLLHTKGLSGELEGFNWEGLSDKQIRDILKNGEVVLKDVEEITTDETGKITKKSIKKKKVKLNNRQKAALETLLENRKTARLFGKLLNHPLLTMAGTKLITQPLSQDPELNQAKTAITTGVIVGKTGVQAGMKAGQAAYKVGHKAVEAVGSTAVNVINKAGLSGAAQALQNVGNAYLKAESAVQGAAAKVSQTPENAMNALAKKIGDGISAATTAITKTTVYTTLSNSAVGKAAGKVAETGKKVLGKAVSIVTKPIYAAGKFVGVLKWIFGAAAFALGLILVVQVLLVIFGGLLSGVSSAIMTIDSDSSQLADYQTTYDAMDAELQARVDRIVTGYADQQNLKGEDIYYGINVEQVTDEETEEVLLSAQYSNGVSLLYYCDGSADSGVSSNIEDVLSAMTVMLFQTQNQHHEAALALIEALYRSTHSYSYTESSLYACSTGCELTEYLCSEIDEGYPSSDLKYDPWLFGEIVEPVGVCEVCEGEEGLSYKDYAGCVVTKTCYHDSDDPDCSNRVTGYAEVDKEDYDEDDYPEDEYPAVVLYYESSSGYDRRSVKRSGTHGTTSLGTYSYTEYADDLDDWLEEKLEKKWDNGCENYEIVITSEKESGTGIWKETYAVICIEGACQGHDHYGCEGHTVAACYGHVNIELSIYFNTLSYMFTLGGVPVIETSADALTTESDSDDETVLYGTYSMMSDDADGKNGAEYTDLVADWVDTYSDEVNYFVLGGGWNEYNKSWAEAIRSLDDFYEIYGIIGSGEYLELTGSTAYSAIIISDEVAESLEIPDNGGNNPVVYMSQAAEPWESVPFGGYTIHRSGCSVTSMAMALSYLLSGTDSDGWVYPSDVVAMIAEQNNGNYNTFYVYPAGQNGMQLIPAVAEYYGIEATWTDSEEEILEALSTGSVVIMRCGAGIFTSAGHFILLTGVTDDGYVVLNDPGHAAYSYQKFSIKSLMDGSLAANPYWYILSYDGD